MPKILILSFSNFASDPRVLRQISALEGDHEIIEAGWGASGMQNRFFPIKDIRSFHIGYPFLIKKGLSLFFRIYREFYLLKVVRDYEKYYWDFLKIKLVEMLAATSPSLVIANDIDTLPLAVSIKKRTGAKIILDAHEYAPLQVENLPNWKKYVSPYKFHLSKNYIPVTDACFTVSGGIAKEYEKLTGKKFFLLRNAPRFVQLPPSDVDSERIHLIHHGAAIPGRNLELMFEVLDFLDKRFVLNLILTPTDPVYYQWLKSKASTYENIVFHPPVPTGEIISFINRFDIGIFLLPPSNFNYRHALPNKFFEFVLARLAVVIGPSIEMAPYVCKHWLGLVGKDFFPAAIAAEINQLDRDMIRKFKQNADQAAKSLAIDQELDFFTQKVNELT